MRFEVLGPLRVVDGDDRSNGDGTGVRLGGPRQQLVLALLLANADTVVPTDALVDGLWGDSPPSAARHTVQGYVSELRKVLGPVIEREGEGYVVRVDESSLDSLEFESLLERGRSQLTDDPAAAASALRAALELWRGPPFTALDHTGILLAERTRLEERQLLALEDRTTADLALGLHREIAAELDALSREHPYRERFRAQHMLALYRSGRQAEALRAFQSTREVLVEDLGIEPSPLLRRLEEQILVQDPALDLASDANGDPSGPSGPVDNPYKGLRAFTEADADLFFGRDELIAELSGVVEGNAGLTAVVGPSGSGKSSLVQAGLIPALRDRSTSAWVIATMRPGAYPFTELEAALGRAVGAPPDRMNLWTHESDVLRAVLGILPDDGTRLLLVIDQFEELFALVDDAQRDFFLRSLIALATDPRGRSRVLVTLRADFYDRPLQHPAFGRLLTGHVVNVMPLAAEELESAALGPASQVGITFERGLLAALIDEVSGQPNALPLFQYTLTELFDHREGSTLTRAAYEELGGIRGAVASRAEAIYEGLDDVQRDATRQLFMRLVTVGRDSDTRRVAAASELLTLDVDVVTLHGAIEAFVSNRLLVRDRDELSGALTLEVAHEALLSEWERLCRWIDDGREDLRQHAAYSLAVDDWLTAGRDHEYLLTGGRLEQFEHWRATTAMRLTASEREFLDEAVRRRDEADAAEIERVAEQARLRRRARARAFALGAAVAAIAAGAIVAVTAAGTERTARIAVLTSNTAAIDERATLYEQGLVRAERDFDLDVERHDRASRTVADDLAAGDNDLVILDADAAEETAPDDLDPSTRYVITDYEGTEFEGLPNVTSHQWAQEQAAFLAGVAAATTTETGIVGFLGASPADRGGQEEYRAGFEAGVESVDPELDVLAVYLTDFGYLQPLDTPTGAREVARRLYEAGADVIFHVAGRSGVGVLDAASDLSTTERWAIGVGADLWPAATTRQQEHILMSIVNRFDNQMYGIIEDHLDGTLEAGSHRLTIADGMISYVANGNGLGAEARTDVDRAVEQIASGDIQPPRSPTGERTEPQALLGAGTGTGSFGDVPVRFTQPDGWENIGWGVIKGDPIVGMFFMEVGNTFTDPCEAIALDPPVGPTVEDLAAVWADRPELNATTPIDITVDGFRGQQVDFTVPDFPTGEYADDCAGGGHYLLLEGVGTPGDGYWAQGPNQHHQLWILDIDGTRVVIGAMWFPDTSARDRAHIDEMLSSIQIG